MYARYWFITCFGQTKSHIMGANVIDQAHFCLDIYHIIQFRSQASKLELSYSATLQSVRSYPISTQNQPTAVADPRSAFHSSQSTRDYRALSHISHSCSPRLLPPPRPGRSQRRQVPKRQPLLALAPCRRRRRLLFIGPSRVRRAARQSHTMMIASPGLTAIAPLLTLRHMPLQHLDLILEVPNPQLVLLLHFAEARL